jgi:hypothetical protein
MEISQLKFHFALTPEDMRSIREAIGQWGKPPECIDRFSGAELYRHFETWQQFVDTNRADWDRSEYDHDIGCRCWIRVAVEHSCSATRTVLESGHFLKVEETAATEQMFAIAGSLQDFQLHEFPQSWFEAKIAK